MIPFRILPWCLLGMIVVGCAAPAPVPSSAEQEARATFVELVDVSKKRQLDRFKALIAAADLEEMEALDKEKPGFFEMLMALIAEGGDPSEYTADVKDDRVIFVRRIREKTADSSSTETTTVTMVRQGNQWRLGKPRT